MGRGAGGGRGAAFEGSVAATPPATPAAQAVDLVSIGSNYARYVCVYVCLYVCVYMCVYICTSGCLRVSARVCARVCVCV